MKRKLSIPLIFLLTLGMVIASMTAFASSESLSKNPDRLERLYAVGETVIFEMQIQNPADPGDPTNTYYYIDDVFSGDLAHVTMYRDKDFNGVIDPAPSPDSDPLVEGTDYLIDGNTIILRWIDGVGDPTHVGVAGPSPELIPTFPGFGDKTLTLTPQDFAYAELHYVVQPEDLGLFITNGINTLGENDVGEKLSAEVETWVKIIDPDIEIVKYVNDEDANSPTGPIIPVGDDVTFTFDVTNTGNVTLTDIDVNDDVYGFIGTIASLAPGATDSTLSHGPVPAEAGQHTNIATAEGNPPVGPPVSDTDPANYFGSDPAIDIEKYVNGEDADSPTGPIVPVGDPVTFTFDITNTGNVDLVDVVVTDDVYGTIGTIPLLPVGATESVSYGPIPAEEGQHTNVATAEGTPPVGPPVSDSDPGNYYGELPPGEEGLTPGYWKNNADKWDANAWVDYVPDDLFDDVFGVDITLRGKGKTTYEDPTLLEALGANGGGMNALARHATAAILNASHPDIAYPMSVAQIITAVQDAIAAGEDAIEDLATMLDMYNNYGANLDMHGNVITP